ncbi:1533_t:CDS:2, partial [Scutellospora calospora]
YGQNTISKKYNSKSHEKRRDEVKKREKVLEAIHNIFQAERIDDKLFIKFNGGMKGEIHLALNDLLRQQLPGWLVLNDVVSVVNRNKFRPDIGGWNIRPTRQQKIAPIINSSPPPLLWIEMTSDHDHSLHKISYVQPYCSNTEFVLIVIPFGTSPFQTNPNPDVDSVVATVPKATRPSRVLYLGHWAVADSDKLISNLGCIKNNKGVILKGNVYKRSGFIRIDLRINSIHTSVSVHILVAQAFISNPENKPYVNHINGIKYDNLAVNLEWVTPKKTLDENVIQIWNSIYLADNILKITGNSISEFCSGKQNTASGRRVQLTNGLIIHKSLYAGYYRIGYVHKYHIHCLVTLAFCPKE